MPDDLEARFQSLEGVPAPDWRARVLAKLDSSTEGDAEPLHVAGGLGRPGRLGRFRGVRRPAWPVAAATAAAIVAVVALTAVAVWPRGDDGGGDDVVAESASGPRSAGSNLGGLPDVDRPLVCPPALLDVSQVEGSVGPGPDRELSEDAGPQPYELTWTQEGKAVTFAYPGYFVRVLVAFPTEEVTVDGRPAVLEHRGDAVELMVGDPSTCGGFEVSVPGDDEAARAAAIAAAEAVRIRAPSGNVAVPDVVDLDRIQAQDVLARAGLVPGQPWALSDFEAQPVTRQDPAPSASVAFGTEISLEVAPPTTTTTTLADPIPDVVLPLPTKPMVCPVSLLDLSDVVFRSEPTVVFLTTWEWDDGGDALVHMSWPSWEYVSEGHATRELSVNGRPALMHDGGDGQDLVFDTGLPDGPCRYLQISVFGGASIPDRERRAESIAARIALAPAPTAPAPDVTGLDVATAADHLARAGFVPDWGTHPSLGDEPTAPPADKVVTAQSTDANGLVVHLTI